MNDSSKFTTRLQFITKSGENIPIDDLPKELRNLINFYNEVLKELEGVIHKHNVLLHSLNSIKSEITIKFNRIYNIPENDNDDVGDNSNE